MGFWSEPFPQRKSFVGKHWMEEKSHRPPSNHLGIVFTWSLFSLQRKQAWNTTRMQRSTMAPVFEAVCKVTAIKNSSPKMLPHKPEVFRRLYCGSENLQNNLPFPRHWVSLKPPWTTLVSHPASCLVQMRLPMGSCYQWSRGCFTSPCTLSIRSPWPPLLVCVRTLACFHFLVWYSRFWLELKTHSPDSCFLPVLAPSFKQKNLLILLHALGS